MRVAGPLHNAVFFGITARCKSSAPEHCPPPHPQALLIIIIYTFSPVSGAHFNPAVTLAFTVVGYQTLASCLLYTVA